MSVTTIYLKRFSKIFNVQEEEEVYYSLAQSNEVSGPVYGIEVSSVCNGKRECDRVESITSVKETVLDIIQYLYENSVKLEAFEDVVNDFINKKVRSF